MNERIETPKQAGAVRIFLRTLVRIIFVIMIGIGIGAGLFYGVSYLTDRYFQSVQTNADQIAALETRLADSSQLLSDRMDSIAARLDTLEVQSDTDKDNFSAIEGKIAALETSFADQQATLTALQSEQETLAATLDPLPDQLTDLGTTLEELETELSNTSEMAAALEAQLLTAADDILTTAQKAEWLQVLALLTRAQLDLSQNNLGLAQLKIETAQPILAELLRGADAEQSTAIEDAQRKLQAALDALPDSQILATSELDTAWNELYALLQPMLVIEATPTPQP